MQEQFELTPKQAEYIRESLKVDSLEISDELQDEIVVLDYPQQA